MCAFHEPDDHPGDAARRLADVSWFLVESVSEHTPRQDFSDRALAGLSIILIAMADTAEFVAVNTSG